LRNTWITGDIFTSTNSSETLRAWKPFHLCQGILFELQNSDIEPRWSHWQVQWIGGLALLRSVGHVLHKVDSAQSESHQKAISTLWNSWKVDKCMHWIFWEFVERERNNILKEFEMGFVDGPYLEAGEYEIEDDVHIKLQAFREAVYWWRLQLRRIEESLQNTE